MALNFSFNTDATSDSGTVLSSAHARIQTTLHPSEEAITTRLRIYESEAAYLAGRKEIWLDEITESLRVFDAVITAGQFANLDMGTIHDQFVSILQEGSGHGNYPPDADQAWLGIQDIDILNTVTKAMPV